MSDVKETVKETIATIITKAQSLGQTAVETAKDAAEKGKAVVEEQLREREANKQFLKLGKKVYKLVKRNELTLPEACDKYIERLNDLYDDADAETPSCEQEACCCCCEKDGEKAEECSECEEKAEEKSDDKAEECSECKTESEKKSDDKAE